MSEPEAPVPSAVTSLLDRLPPERRARHLATIALRDKVENRAELAQLAEAAAQLATFDADAMLAAFDQMPPGSPDMSAAKAACRTARGAQQYLRGDTEGALAEWATVIDELPEHAASALLVRSVFVSLRGDPEAALADLNRAIDLDPRGAEGYSRRGDIYDRMGRRAEAAANYLRAAQIDPDDTRANAGMGRCLLREGEWSRAIPWYTRAIRSAPSLAHLHIERALCFENLDRFSEAIADLDVAIACDPDDAETFHARGRCRPAAQRADAIADFSRAIELNPLNADLWAVRGRAHLLTASFDAAIADATRAIELDAALPGPFFTRALATQAGKDVALALQDYEEAARLAPTELLYVKACLMAHQKLGDARGLRADLDTVVALQPAHPELQREHARLLAAEGSFERALSHFDAALALGGSLTNEEQAELHHERASVLRELARIEEAAAAEEQAVRLAPEVADYHSWLGMFRSKIDAQAHLAEGDMTRAIELCPDDPVLRLKRALYYEHVERWDAAIADHDAAVELAPTEGAFYFRRGVARWQSSDDEEPMRAALVDYDRAIELGGDDAEVLRWRADAHIYFEDYASALGDAERALLLEPDSGEAFHTRSRCKALLGDTEGARDDLERAAELGWPAAVDELGESGTGSG